MIYLLDPHKARGIRRRELFVHVSGYPFHSLAFEKVIDGKKLSTSDKVKIRDYIMEKHGREIKQLKECEYTAIMAELQNKPAAGVQI